MLFREQFQAKYERLMLHPQRSRNQNTENGSIRAGSVWPYIIIDKNAEVHESKIHLRAESYENIQEVIYEEVQLGEDEIRSML